MRLACIRRRSILTAASRSFAAPPMGRRPALDVLGSRSRVAPHRYGDHERSLVERARRLMRAYADAAEPIQPGAHRTVAIG